MANQQNTPDQVRIPARISGEALGQVGFNRPITGDLTLIAKCFGPWCAQPVAGAKVLAFVRQDAQGVSLSVDPCGGDAFFDPAPAMLDKAHRCFIGGECTPDASE